MNQKIINTNKGRMEKDNRNDPSTYDKLECPDCDKLCSPKKVLKNGTVVYQKHSCSNGDDCSFAIDINGDLVE